MIAPHLSKLNKNLATNKQRCEELELRYETLMTFNENNNTDLQ
jgi:hypothetical protein